MSPASSEFASKAIPAALPREYEHAVLDPDDTAAEKVLQNAIQYYGAMALHTDFNSVYIAKLVQCPRCPEILSVRDLEEHFKLEESENSQEGASHRLECMRCSNMTIRSLDDLAVHAERRHVRIRFKCVFCCESLKNKEAVEAHYFPAGRRGGCEELVPYLRGM